MTRSRACFLSLVCECLSREASARQIASETYWHNLGANQVQDADRGEFYKDIGGMVPFKAYTGSHCYANPVHKDAIVRYFFDRDRLNAHLTDPAYCGSNPCFDCVPMEPIWAPDDDGASTGFASVWYVPTPPMPGNLYWEQFYLNGAHVTIKHRKITISTPLADPLYLVLSFQGGFRDPLQGNRFGDDQQDDVSPPPWSAEPLDMEQQAIAAGYIVAEIYENFGNDTFTNLQRALDAHRYLTHARGFTIAKVFSTGGSWGALSGNMLGLFAPSLVNGIDSGAMMADFGFETPLGDWQKIISYLQTGIDTPVWTVPPRVHSWPAYQGIEAEMHVPELIGNYEMSAFSIVDRTVYRPEDFKTNFIGEVGNYDPHYNVHWHWDDLKTNPKLDWINVQFGGHGDNEASDRHFSYNTGDELSHLDGLNDPVDTDNPPLKPPAQPTYDAYPKPYDHTLRVAPSTGDITSSPNVSYPFLVSANFSAPVTYPSQYETLPRIGQGVQPGAFDQMRLTQSSSGDQLLVFGNFDGFVHVMKLAFDSSSPAIPYLTDVSRSTPLGWGIASLVLGTSGASKFVLAANSMGKIYKMTLSASGVLGPAQPWAVGVQTHLGTGYLHHMTLGNFTGAGPNEVFIQNELNEFILISSTGAYRGKTDRDYDPATNDDDVVPLAGPPVAADVDGDGRDELFVPCLDGSIRRIDYEGLYDLQVTMASPWLRNVPRCSLVYDPNGNPNDGFNILLGVEPNEHSAKQLLMVSITNGGAALAHAFGIPPGVPKDACVSLDWYDASHTKVVAAIGPDVVVLDVNVSSGFASPPTPLPARIPGIPVVDTDLAALPSWRPALCSIETAGGGSSADYVYVATPNGRFFVLNRSDLAFTRTSFPPLEPMAEPPNVIAMPWPNNRTFGYCFGAAHHIPDATTGYVYVDDSHMPYGQTQNPSITNFKRIARIDPTDGTIDDWEKSLELQKDVEGILNDRSLAVVQKPNSSEYAFYTHWEATAAHRRVTTDTALTRYGVVGGTLETGYLRWRLGDGTDEHGLLNKVDNFFMPIFADQGLSEYPHAPEGRVKGQIATFQSLTKRLYHGYSMRIMPLPRQYEGPTAEYRDHVLVGTPGGLFAAIDPNYALGDSALSYYSKDLGWHCVGLDTGDLDGFLPGGDPDPEILVGTLLDTGSKKDYRDGKVEKNRGALVMLDVPSTPAGATAAPFVETRLDIVGVGPTHPDVRLAAGIFGISIDDINGDGRAEIWVGDAAGYVYALYYRFATSKWECFFRSRSLGAFAGAYNTIFPINGSGPGADPATDWLIVFTAGYVYRFSVLNMQVPID